MSFWTYITGVIKVWPMGRTQAEKRYILDTVLAHLPNVTGSENDMYINVLPSHGSQSSSSCDEFQMNTDNLIDRYGQRNRAYGWLECQEEYLLILQGNFRDRMFEQTYQELQNWLCRLSKRIRVCDVLIQISGYDKHEIISNAEPYREMYEEPSWYNDTGEPNWCEYLMWNRFEDWSLPLEHVVKYYACDSADKEWDKKLNRTEED